MVLVFEEFLLSPFFENMNNEALHPWLREAKLNIFECGRQGHVLQYLGLTLDNF
jgi:hypothetical protein